MSDWTIWKPKERFSYDVEPVRESRTAKRKRRKIHKGIKPTVEHESWADRVTPPKDHELRRASQLTRHPERAKLTKDYLVTHTTSKGCRAPVLGQGQGKERVKGLGARARFKGELDDYQAWIKKTQEQERLAELEGEAFLTPNKARFMRAKVPMPSKSRVGRKGEWEVKTVPARVRHASKATPIMRDGRYSHDVQSAVNPSKRKTSEPSW